MKTTITLKQKLLEASQHLFWKSTNNRNFLKLRTNNLFFLLLLLFSLALIPTRCFAKITTDFKLDRIALAAMPNPHEDWNLIFNGISKAQFTNITCKGLANGPINLCLNGGKSPITYLWNNAATKEPANTAITEPAVLSTSQKKVDVLCFGENNGSIDLSVSGGTSPYTYLWSNGATTQDISGLNIGTYSVVVTDFHNCTTTASETINQAPAVSCLLEVPNLPPVCGSTGNPLTATVSNVVSYVWSVVGGKDWAINSGQGTPSIIYSAGKDSARFKLVVTDSNGYKDSCAVTVKIGSCVKVKSICTLTQGFWSNANGVACATGEKSTVLVNRLLGAPFGDLIIGKPGCSLTITQAKASSVTLKMSSDGPSVPLPAIDQLFGTDYVTTIPVNSQGKFTNTLLGQTIALGFNIRLDNDLGPVVLRTSFTTMDAKPGTDGLCGTKDGVPDFTSVHSVAISSKVISALNSLYSSPTIANLFDLANRALGGQAVGRTTLSEIANALDAINQGFDGCRFVQINSGVSLATGEINTDHASDILMKAFPNPFENSTTIEFMPKTDGKVTVNVYTLSGANVAELFDGQLRADESKQVIFNGTNLPNGIYIYKITVDDKVYFDKLILQK